VGIPRGILIGVTVVSAVLFYALGTHMTFNPLFEQDQGGFAGQFYWAQAQVLVHGHLAVAPTQLPGECFIYHGRCYGYFGLTPSLIRLPFLPLLNAVNKSLTPVFMAAALTLAVASGLGILSRMLARVRRTPLTMFLEAALALCIGPASVLVMVTRPAVYEEAIVWSVAFSLLGVYAFLRWWSTQSRGWAIVLVVSLALGTNSRPTLLPVGVLLAAGIFVRILLERWKPARARRALAFAWTVALVPIISCLGTWYLKFHTAFPSILLNEQIGGSSAAPWWKAIRHIDHNTLDSVRYVPTGLLAYLRPVGVILTSAYPYITFGGHVTYVGIPPGSLYLEPFSTLPSDMTLVVILIIAGLLYGAWTAIRRAGAVRPVIMDAIRSPMTYAILGTAASCGVTMSNAFITNRYLADFMPALVVLLAVAARFLAPPVVRVRGVAAVAVGAVVTVFVLWSLFVVLGLDYAYWWHTTV
jgi:hypothetical protein